MQFYSAKVRLSGSTMNEVRDVFSTPQILIMQYMHGVDAITDIKPAKVEKLNMTEYKSTLRAMYDPALVKRDQSVDKIFGALGQLPTKLPDEVLEQNDIIDEDDVVAVAKATTKADKNAQSNHQPQTQAEADRLDTLVPQNQVNMDDIME